MKGNILITGSNGFMGKNLVDTLKRAQTHNIFEIEREKSFWKGEEHERVELDSLPSVIKVISNIEFDQIYHFAGASSVIDSWDKPFQSLLHNTMMTSNLVQAIKDYSSDTKLIFISSSAVYARKSTPISETDPLGPDSPYGMSKLISEYETKGVKNSLVIRPFFVIGNGKTNDVLYDWINQILAFKNTGPKILEVGNIDTIRDFISVETATEVITQLGSAELGVFNLGSGLPTSLRELIEILKEVSGVDFEVAENVTTKMRNRDRNQVIADINQLNSVCKLTTHPNLTENIREIFRFYVNLKH